MSVTRKTELKADNEGRFRPYVGWKVGEDGIRRQHRFNFGRDRVQAEQRLARVRQLFDESSRATGDGTWTPFALFAAEQLADGVTVIPYAFQEWIAEEWEDGFSQAQEYVNDLRNAQQLYPSLIIVPSDPRRFADGLSVIENLKKDLLSEAKCRLDGMGIATANGSFPPRLITGTLHQALDVYAKTIPQEHSLSNGNLSEWGAVRLAQVERLKLHHEDAPLYLLNIDRISEFVDYWRNAPTGKRNRPVKNSTIKNQLTELKRFLRWLHRTADFDWTSPPSITELKWSPKRQAGQAGTFKVKVFSEDQLAILNRHATPQERLLLLLGLNCGFGAGEAGTLTLSEIDLLTSHPYASKLDWRTSDDDSFIRRLRQKNHVWGEFLLWPQTVTMLKWAVEDRRRHGAKSDDSLLVGIDGKPVYQRGRGRYFNGQAIAHTWNRLVDRVRKGRPDFPKFSFGKLRKTGGTLVWRVSTGDVASMFLCHGSATSDDLLEVYANRPFGKVFQALVQVEALLDQVFAAAPACPTQPLSKECIPLEVTDRIHELLDEGKPVMHVAEAAGVSPTTVRRRIEQRGSQIAGPT